MIGFDSQRVELAEGEAAEIRIAFEVGPYSAPEGPVYLVEGAVANLRNGFDLPVAVEGVTADGEDLLIADGVRIRAPAGALLLRENTWLAMYAPLDGIAEGVETLKLRLSAPEFSRPGEAPEVQFTNREAEVVIRDGGADPGRAVEIHAGEPQPVDKFNDAYTHAYTYAYATEVVVVSDGAESVGLDVMTEDAAMERWQTQVSGSRVEHRIRLAWEPRHLPRDLRTCELRLRPVTEWGAGPTLVCSPLACRIYGPGEIVPPPIAIENCPYP